MLREAHHDFSVDERQIIAGVLFEEACAHARSKRQEETSGSLATAIEAGFDDLQRLKSEPDFEEFRKIPSMAKMLAQAANTVESRATAQARALLAAGGTSESDLSRLGGQVSRADFAMFKGKVLLVLAGDPHDERQVGLHDQLAQLKEKLSSPDLEIQRFDLGESAVKSLPGSPQCPVILFLDRAGKLRLVLSGPQRPVVLEALVRELVSAPSQP